MKIANKLCVVLMVLLILLSTVLVGCGGQQTQQETPKQPIDAQEDSSYVAGKLPTVNAQQKQPSDGNGTTPPDDITDGVWVPDIIDKDPDVSLGGNFDDSQKYTYDGTFVAKSGNITQNGAVYTSTVSGTLAVVEDEPFPYGTISCKVTSTNTSDTGIVFGLTGKTGNYWEQGVSYYFYFIGQGGSAYLGKVTNGSWAALQVVQTGSAVQANTQYELKIVFKSNVIWCYLNGEFMFAYRDAQLHTGTGYGIRTGASGATFTDFTITNEYLY